MPGMSGFEVAEYLRTHKKSCKVPIIFITAMERELKNVLKGFKEGAVDFLSKPVNPDFLRAKVNVFLRLENQRKEIEQQNARLQQLGLMVEHAADLMCILNRHSLVYEEINPSFRKLLGYSPEELLGEKFVSLFTNLNDMLAFEYELQRYASTKIREMHFECKFKTKSGSAKCISFNVTEKFDKWFVNGQDISQLKISQEKLSVLNTEMEDFTQLISQEIQAPLNSGIYYLHQLQKEIEPKKILQHTRYLDHYLTKARQLADEMKFYSQEHDVRKEEVFRLNDAIEEAMDNLIPEMEQTGASVQCDDSHNIKGFRMQMTFLFQNLLMYSIETFKQEHPKIHISVLKTPNNLILLYREIDKLKIPSHEKPDFNQQLKNDNRLRICNQLVKNWEDSLTIDNEAGNNVIFYISINKKYGG